MSYKISTSELGSAVGNSLYAFYDDLQAGIVALTNEKAAKLLDKIKNGAPVDWRKVKRRGRYKKSWRIRTTADTPYSYERTVYSAKEYRLTHLLEFGHKTKNGGKTKAQAHIAPAYEQIKTEYLKEINDEVRLSGKYGSGRKSYKK